MDIKTMEDLARLADVCRKKGIKEIKVSPAGDLTVTLGERPESKPRGRAAAKKEELQATPPPTDEELLFWSSGSVQ